MPDSEEVKAPDTANDFALPKHGHPADDYNVYAPFSDLFVEKNEKNHIDVEKFKLRGSAGFRDEHAECRVQVSRCYNGRALGLVVRGKHGNSSILPGEPTNSPEEWCDLVHHLADVPFYSSFEPNPEIKSSHLNSIREICEPLYRLLFPRDETRKGLLIVAGATASAKTQIANGLIHLYLEQRMNEWWKEQIIRKPHLVTFEEPIETELIEWERLKAHTMDSECRGWHDSEGSMQWCNSWKFPDYTPREKPTDVKNLKLAVSDALRQTPTVFYSAETRSHEDWPLLFKLAESHLVVTTTHASSIIAAFNSLLAGLKFRTPTQRSEFASVLLGVIHLRPDETESTPALAYNLPSLWRRTPYGTKAFAAEGMSSLVPIYVDNLAIAGTQEFYYLGRQTFAKILTDQAMSAGATSSAVRRFNKLKKDGTNENQLTKPADDPQRNPNISELSVGILDKAVDLDLRAE